jgi:hypothetical protein
MKNIMQCAIILFLSVALPSTVFALQKSTQMAKSSWTNGADVVISACVLIAAVTVLVFVLKAVFKVISGK